MIQQSLTLETRRAIIAHIEDLASFALPLAHGGLWFVVELIVGNAQ